MDNLLPRHAHRGFTLMELSVVLAVIGIIAAGVLAGRNLVQQATLRSVLQEYNMYYTAASAFYASMQERPGDMYRAYQLWGADCAATEGACNGNGDGRIAGDQEIFMAWKHLALAGLVTGSFSGAGVAHSGDMMVGVNIPASKMAKAGWFFDSNDSPVDWVDSSIKIYNFLNFGSKSNGGHYYYSVLTPAQAYLIDEKLDDGMPYTGKILGMVGDNCCGNFDTNCTTGTGDSATYAISLNEVHCRMLFSTPWNTRYR